jgi:hypothetical protein
MSEPFPDSVEESSLRRRTVLWKQSRPGGGRPTLQMRQNSLNHRRIFNADNDLDLPGAPLAGLNLDIKNSLEPLHPCHRSMALGDVYTVAINNSQYIGVNSGQLASIWELVPCLHAIVAPNR